MQQPGEPVFVAENELAGEEHAVGIFLLNLFRELDQFVDAVGSQREAGGCGESVRVAIVDVERQRPIERRAHFLDLLCTAIALRVDGLGADENEVAEVVRKQPLHPEYRMDATAPARADHEHRARRL